MAYDTLLATREETFAVITLNRPPANAISPQLMTDLGDALAALESDDEGGNEKEECYCRQGKTTNCDKNGLHRPNDSSSATRRLDAWPT